MAVHLLLTNKTYIGCFLGGLVVAWVVTPWVIRLAKRVRVLDQPNHRKIHRVPTPLLGGLAIYLGMWLPVGAFAFWWDNAITHALQPHWREIALIWGAGTLMLGCGIWDDAKGINALKKLAFQIPIAVGFALWIGSFGLIEIPGMPPIQLGNLGVVLTIVWIIGVANAINLIDGIDGLATGVTALIALTIAVVALLNGNPMLALVMFSLGGACLGFLRFNFAPAKIFLGDTGSLFIGMTLATASVLASGKSQMMSSLIVAIVVLGYPIADTLLAIARRALHGKPILTSDQGHIHHRLLATGFDHRRAAMILYVFCAMLGLLALSIVMDIGWLIAISMGVVILMMTVGLHVLGFFRPFFPDHIREHRPRFLIAFHTSALVRAKFALTRDPMEIFQLVRHAAQEFDGSDVEIRVTDTLPAISPRRFFWHQPDFAAASPSTIDDAFLESASLSAAGSGGRRDLHFESRFGLEMTVTMDARMAETDLGIERRQQLASILDAAGNRLAQLASEMPILAPAPALPDPPAAKTTVKLVKVTAAAAATKAPAIVATARIGWADDSPISAGSHQTYNS